MYDENANGKDVELAVGQQFEICLPELPTTGFQWSFTSNGEPACVLLNSSYTATKNQYDGEGSRCWQFQAAQTGSTHISIVYQRPWEQAAPPARSFTLTVHVQAST